MSRTNRILSFVAVMLVAVTGFAQPQNTERLLIPILTPPVHGAHGSEFHTELRIANTGDDFAFLLGLNPICPTCLIDPDAPLVLNAGVEVGPGEVAMNGSPGRFVLAPVNSLGTLPMNLRVFDVSRDHENYGTEIPIVRESQFATNVLSFVGVPTDPRFRNTLRIYSDVATDVLVTVGNQEPVRVELKGGFSLGDLNPDNVFEPAYGMFTNFPTSGGPVRVTIEVDTPIIIISLLPFETKLWGFITVTNNDTQAIATITPQP